MKPEDEKFEEYMKILNELRDRMMEAGLITRHGYAKEGQIIGAEFSPQGQEVVTVIAGLDKLFGRPDNRKIIAFWLYIREIADARSKRV